MQYFGRIQKFFMEGTHFLLLKKTIVLFGNVQWMLEINQ